MWVKICGTTSMVDAALAAQQGAEAVGFIFAPSRRQVTPAQVAAITHNLPTGIEKVGVFAQSPVSTIAAQARQAGLTVVQLHFRYDPSSLEQLQQALPDIRIIQVVTVDTAGVDAVALHRELSAVLAQPAVWAVLLDASHAGVSGGLGASFSWEHVAPTLRSIDLPRSTPPKILVAGGLHAGNLGRAVNNLRPWGVDVCSGVEGSPGRKDPAKVSAFVAAARATGAAYPGR